MARNRLILLMVGVLAAGIGPATAVPREELSAWFTSPPDTSTASGLDSLRGGGPPWSRRDFGLHWLDCPAPGRYLPANSLAGMARSGEVWSAGAPVADPHLWGANGNVLDIARSGNTLYIAGAFRSVGENIGGFVPFDSRTGEALRPFPKVAGSVYAIVADGSGGWYIGGAFTAVGGKPRSSLAQVRSDGSVSDWNPSVTGSPGYIDPPTVNTIALWGDRVYVGGGFREIGGLPRMNLGCVDARTGAVLDWSVETNATAWVYTMVVHDSTVFVGGFFSSIGGQTRSYIAALDAATATVRPWQANASGSVWALLVREDTLLVAGEFGGIAGGIRRMLAALDVHTAQLLPFDAHGGGIFGYRIPLPKVRALALVGDTLYVAGDFTRIGGQPRSSLAALNVASGEALTWAPPAFGPQYDGFPPPLCLTLAVSRGTLYVGGYFATAGGQSHPFVACLSRETGAVSDWNPKPDLPVYALAAGGDTLYVGGEFSLVGEWRHRAGLAAIDLTTGTLKPWNPNPDGSIVTALAVGEGRVFVSGNFTTIGGQARRYFAALDTINGEATDWNPGVNSLANALLLAGDTLYAGGEFTQVGGQPREYLAAIDATTGAVTGWDPSAGYVVLALAKGGSTIYVGGLFFGIGDKFRRGIAAVDATTGEVTPWNPDTDNSTVEALLVSGNTVYAGGGFNQIGGQPRKSLAALDAVTGVATAWNPDPTNWDIVTPRIRALALYGSALCVGGSFASIGGQPRICLAAVDTATGLATDWDPGVDGLVWSLASDDGTTIYAGGGFARAGGLPSAGLVAFSLPVEPPPPSASLPFALTQSIPNPARSSAIIRFALPASSAVTLSVYDIQGRRVATPLDHVYAEAGRHDVPLQTNGWKPGVYLYRLEAAGRSATRKMVVVE